MPSSISRRHPAYTQYSIERNSKQSSSHPLAKSDTPEFEEATDKPILALNYKNKNLGGAFWRPHDSTLLILADVFCSDPPDLLSLGNHQRLSTNEVKLQTSPSILLVPSRVDESFVAAIQPTGGDNYAISIRPAIEFSYEKAREKLLKLARILPYASRLNIEIPDETIGGQGQNILQMGGLIEWTKQNSVCFQWHLAKIRLVVPVH
jgi:hypothetical protein